MICENYFCIYWKKNKCILDDIYLNSLGVCESCINISIPDEELDRLRKEQLADIEDLD